jgi:hypothetical protein
LDRVGVGDWYGEPARPESARHDSDDLPAASFHITEVDRIAQLVKAATVMLGARLDGAAQRSTAWRSTAPEPRPRGSTAVAPPA